MVAVTRSVKIYFQTPWILAQYTFDFALTLFYSLRLLVRPLTLTNSFALSSVVTCVEYFSMFYILSLFRTLVRSLSLWFLFFYRLYLCLSMNAFWSFQFWYKVDVLFFCIQFVDENSVRCCDTCM